MGLRWLRTVAYRSGWSRRRCAGGVPVLGEDDVVESFGECVDQGDDGVAAFHGQCASGHEVVLDVDDEEGIRGVKLHDLIVVQSGGVRSSFVRAHISKSRYGAPKIVAKV